MLRLVADSMRRHWLKVKYVCADGDSCHHPKHVEFFQHWYPVLIEQGLKWTIDYIRNDGLIPIGNFQYIWKCYCSKVKNYRVTPTPNCPENSIDGQQLEDLVPLRNVLRDKSPPARIRDSHTLRLFSLRNCLICADNNRFTELLYLLPWDLQEDGIKNPSLSREGRLEKVILSFKLLLHSFELSAAACADGVSARFHSPVTEAVAFAERAVWRTLLNSSLALIDFIMHADEHWLFSRIGTHCPENFLGLVPRQLFGDDRYTVASRISVKTSLVASVTQEFGLQILHRHRENHGGVEIRGSPPSFHNEFAEEMLHSLIEAASFRFHEEQRLRLFSAPEFNRSCPHGAIMIRTTTGTTWSGP
jgi:hypothetical protein